LVVFALLGPWLAPSPDAIDPDIPLHLPMATHWLGTDDLGRDVLARLALGAQISLLVGLMTALVSATLGTIYGILAAYYRGWLDTLLMRSLDVIYSLPTLMIVILLGVFLGRSLPSLVLALALFSWPDTARLVRGRLLQIQQEEYIEAYHSLGGPVWRLFLTHFLPNITGVLIVSITMTVPRAILTESTLSFVGLGIAPPLSSWGTMIADGWSMIRLAPHLLLLPSLMLVASVTLLYRLGTVIESYMSRQQLAE
jgi:oligopeptide transport system permease protein